MYLFLDGQYHAARQGTDEKEGVLSAYALLEDGRPVLLHLDVGPRESYDEWLSFLQDLVGLECLERDLEECVTALRFPEAHHQRIRTTNRLERLNGEGRRRTKVIPRFPTERSCLSLLYASLIAASKHWRGIPMTAATLRQLQQLRAVIAAPTKEEAVA